MTFLELKPLTQPLLPAAVALDRQCLGGIWTLDGYQRELESPNSDLLALSIGQPLSIPIPDKPSDANKNRKRPARYISSLTTPIAVRNTLQNANHRSVPQQHPQVLVGLGCLWAILTEAHITLLAIHPNYQRQGLGLWLLCALLQSSQQRGLEAATLEVRASNQSALMLYQKFGFQTAGCRKRYYQAPEEDALVLWRSGIQSDAFSQTLADWQQRSRNRLHQAGWHFLD